MSSPTYALLKDVRQGWAPPPEFTVSQFADAELIVPTGPYAGTRWNSAIAPYQAGITDAFNEPGVEIVVVEGSSQWGKTSICLNLVAFFMSWDPCSILVVEYNLDMAKDFSKNRLELLIEASPRLREVVDKKRDKHASNTVLSKTFRGGSLTMIGAGSAGSLASRAIRLLILDEVDRYESELAGEGNTIEIALKRTTTFGHRRRVLIVSSPSMKGAAIDAWFQRGDRRHYHVPCPTCGTYQKLEWGNVRWDNHDPQTARIECTSCHHGITDAERVAILSAGQWVADVPERKEKHIVSYHMWEGYSPFSSLRNIVANFLSAREAQKRGDASVMHTWQNTTLGEPVEQDTGEGVEPHTLMVRREVYPETLPPGVVTLTCGVDTQDDRLEAVVVGWGEGEEMWIVDRATFPGDTMRAEPWDELTKLLDEQYRHANGDRLTIRAMAVDSGGHRTDLVYHFATKNAARYVYAIHGKGGQYPIVSSPSPRRYGQGERKVPLYTFGVDAIKSILMARLLLTEAGPGYVHLPIVPWCDEEFCEQLTSERLKTTFVRGQKVQAWKKIRPRNEGLDTTVYAIGAFYQQQPDVRRRHAWLEDTARSMRQLPGKPEKAPPTLPPPPKSDPWMKAKPAGWLNRRPPGWLKGR